MTKGIIAVCIGILIGLFACNSLKNKRSMENKNNPLLCDTDSGACEMPGEVKKDNGLSVKAEKKPVKIIYFTDPICSSCWGIEPQLRKLKLEYGDAFEIEYRMGGLLPDWSYNSGGISKPSDVAHHWDEVSLHYDMPIDGDVWLEDPLHSSYPPSIAFKAAQMQDHTKAIKFLRRIREMVFLEKKNITRWEHLQQAAIETGLDPVRLKADFEGPAKQAFQNDLDFARNMGVRGFPTLFISETSGNQVTVYGVKAYEIFESAILKMFPAAVKNPIDTRFSALFGHYPTLTAKEYSVLTGLDRAMAEETLNGFYIQKLLTRVDTKNGMLWRYNP